MATIAHRLNRTDLAREARVEITIYDTPPRRMAWSLGMVLIRAGVWLMGLAGIDVREEHGS